MSFFEFREWIESAFVWWLPYAVVAVIGVVAMGVDYLWRRKK